MDSTRQREIARKGGKEAHRKGTAHEFTSEEARAAGRKGGERVSANRDHMSRIGRVGGRQSAGRRQTAAARNGGASVENTMSEMTETESMPDAGRQAAM